MLADVQTLLHAQNIKLRVSSAAKRALIKEGYDPNFGARPLRRVIQRRLENSLSEELLASRFRSGQIVEVDYQEKKGFTFKALSSPETKAAKPARPGALKKKVSASA